MGVQIGVTGATISMRKCSCDEAFGVDLRDAARSDSSEGRVVLHERQCVVDGTLVAFLDDLGDRSWCHCPQHARALVGREGEVVSRYGGGLFAGLAGDESCQFAAALWRAPVGLGEHFCGDRGAHFRPDFFGDRRVPVLGLAEVVIAVGDGQALLEWRLPVVDVKGAAQFDRFECSMFRSSLGNQFFDKGRGVGVQSEAEDRLHLILGDFRSTFDSPKVFAGDNHRVASFRGSQRLHAPADPPARRFALFGVVGTQ